MHNPAHAPIDRVPLGVTMMVLFCISAPMIDVFAKLASQHVTVTQVTLARYGFQTMLMVPLMVSMTQRWRFSMREGGLLLWRSVVGLVSTYTFIAAVQVMPIADAIAIVFIEPFLLLALGYFYFSELVGPRRIIACAVGFVGALFVIQPNFVAFGAVALYPLGTAVAFAFYFLVTRQLSRTMAPVAMNFHSAWISVVLMVPLLAFGMGFGVTALSLAPPSPTVWAQLFGVGLAASVAHTFITYALRFAPSATLAPLHYLEIIGAVAFGWLFFGDWPNPLSWVGIVTICASGLYVIHRERVTAKALAASQVQPIAR